MSAGVVLAGGRSGRPSGSSSRPTSRTSTTREGRHRAAAAAIHERRRRHVARHAQALRRERVNTSETEQRQSPSAPARQRPAPASIRSVWSRLGAGLGHESSCRRRLSLPAISTHDLTCALATGSTYEIAVQRRAAHERTAGSRPTPVTSIRAPIRPSGSATRSTGRRRIDSSPSSYGGPPGPRAIRSKRISVPALPTSIGAPSALRPGRRQ